MTLVRFVMSRRIALAPGDTKVRDGRLLLSERGAHYILVADGGRVMGVTCACDLIRADGDASLTSCISAPALGIGDGASLDDAAHLMRERGVECLPVFSPDHRLLGIVTSEQLRHAGVSHDALPGRPPDQSCAAPAKPQVAAGG